MIIEFTVKEYTKEQLFDSLKKMLKVINRDYLIKEQIETLMTIETDSDIIEYSYQDGEFNVIFTYDKNKNKISLISKR